CFLMERQYAPYAKWFGTAFQRLNCGPTLSPTLMSVVRAETWRERERSLVIAYEAIARMHNELGITQPLRETAGSFFNRPFQVIHLAAYFAGAICDRIRDPEVMRIASKRLIGNIDQISDNTDIVSSTEWRETLRLLYL